jgi:hypothetical protein
MHTRHGLSDSCNVPRLKLLILLVVQVLSVQMLKGHHTLLLPLYVHMHLHTFCTYANVPYAHAQIKHLYLLQALSLLATTTQQGALLSSVLPLSRVAICSLALVRILT